MQRVWTGQTHSKVAIGTAAFGDGLTDFVHQVVVALGGRVDGGGRRMEGFLVELDRHGGSMGCDGSGRQMGA